MGERVLKNPNINNITFKKPEKISNKIYIIDVKYNKNKQFIIQTPKFLVPFLPSIYSHRNLNFYKLCLEANNYLFNNSTKQFVKLIKNIDTYIKDKSPNFWKKCGYSEKKKTFKNSYNFNKNKSKVYFYFGIQVLNNNPEISIYDWKKDEKSYNYITPQSRAYSLIWLKNIWLKGRKIGLNWVILQMKIYLPIYKIKECLIEDDEDEINFKTIQDDTNMQDTNIQDTNMQDTNIQKKLNMEDDPVYGKFFKMKKFGIPIECIRHKLKMESLDPNIISININKSKIKPKLYTKTHTKSIKSIKKSKPGNLINILSGLGNVKLKKTKKRKKKERKKKQSLSNRAPSLEQILKQKNSLKKTHVKLI